MRSKEWVTKFRRRFQNSPLSAREALLVARILCHDLAEDVHRIELADGQHINDQIDFSALLREIEAVIDHEEMQRTVPVSRVCPRCGHVHQGDSECGQEMGPGRICRCELEVPA